MTSKEESIKHFKLRRKRHENMECTVCCEDKDLYEFDCGDCEHCYCLDCYKQISKCPSCQIPKNPYYTSLFQEEYLPEIPTVQAQGYGGINQGQGVAIGSPYGYTGSAYSSGSTGPSGIGIVGAIGPSGVIGPVGPTTPSFSGNQGSGGVAIGTLAGNVSPSLNTIAIGYHCGYIPQYSPAIGHLSGNV